MSNSIVDAFGQALASLVTGGGDADQIIADLMGAFGQFLRTMGESIAAYGLAVEAFEMAFENPAAAILAGLALVAAGYAVEYYAAEGMANGGVVPAGYPNDTYPAMLTSGETVVPAKKLPEFGGNTTVNVQVTGVQRGEDIHYILQKVSKRLNRVN